MLILIAVLQQIDEVRQVGSFKKGTMLKGRNKADLVVILRTLPVVESVRALGSRLIDELVKIDSSTAYKLDHIPGGFEIMAGAGASEATIRILVTTTTHNMRKLDAKLHVPARLLQRNMSAIRHMRWFEDSANLTTIKVLIRILRDTSMRFEGLFMLSPWMIDVLAHYSVMFRHSEQLLSLGAAFKRVFQLLSAGLFLPGSTGVPDPCENGAITLHTPLTNSQMDRLCMTCQTLLRVLSQPSGINVVLGFEPDTTGITTNESNWGEVTIVPSLPVAPAAQASGTNVTDENGQDEAINNGNGTEITIETDAKLNL